MVLNLLAEKNVNGQMLKWLRSFFTDTQARVQCQSHSSDYMKFDLGTPQGSVLSPFLFNLLMDEVLKTELPNGAKLYSYADDLAMVFGGKTCFLRLQTALQALGQKFLAQGLQLNFKKTKMMTFGFKTKMEFLIYDQQLHIVRQYTYLGVIFSMRGLSKHFDVNFRKYFVEIRSKVIKRMNILSSTTKAI